MNLQIPKMINKIPVTINQITLKVVVITNPNKKATADPIIIKNKPNTTNPIANAILLTP